MRINHIAIWTKDLEKLKAFYLNYFNAKSGEKYCNSMKQYSSYFLYFEDGCSIEIMNKSGLMRAEESSDKPRGGFAHLSFSVGSPNKLDELTERLRKDGFTIIGEPRITGDGYYESVIADPDGNFIEITI